MGQQPSEAAAVGAATEAAVGTARAAAGAAEGCEGVATGAAAGAAAAAATTCVRRCGGEAVGISSDGRRSPSACVAASSTCAFVPPIPKADTPARLTFGAPSTATSIGRCAHGTSSLSGVAWIEGGAAPW